MKALAGVQLILAVISVVPFAVPSWYVLIWSPLLFIVIVCFWISGIRLLVGYYNITRGRLSSEQHYFIERYSVLFNLPSLLLGLTALFSINTEGFSLSDVPNRVTPFVLLNVPGMTNAVLSTIGCYKSMNAINLERKKTRV